MTKTTIFGLLMCMTLVHPTLSGGKAVHHAALDPSLSDADLLTLAANVVPSPRQLAYQQEEFTTFIHFGPNTFTGREWGTGKEDPTVFAPDQVDTDQWCEVAKAAGMRKILITVKHHDGYCLWQTRYNTTFSVHQSPWKDGKGDVLRLLANSCRKYGLRLGVYLSPADLYQIESETGLYGNGSTYEDSVIPTDPASFASNPTRARDVADDLPTFRLKTDHYNRYFMNQLYELLTEYGPIHEVWFDGAHPKRKGGQTYLKAEWFDMIRELAPEAVIFGGLDVRWCGNEHGGTRESEWSVLPVASFAESGVDRPANNVGDDAALIARDYEVYGKTYSPQYLMYLISEVDTSIRKGWFWRNEHEQQVRSPEEMFDIYERAVGGNAVFLLNVPPNRNGRISARDESVLREVGQRIRATYGVDLAEGMTSGPKELRDHSIETYWQPGGEQGDFTVQLDAPQTSNRIMLQEAISSVGQRVKAHALDAYVDGKWEEIAQATTIGYKRILRFPDVTTDRFRVRILASRESPSIAHFSAHHDVEPSRSDPASASVAGHPLMSPAGWRVSASSAHPGYEAGKAIDRNPDTFWHTSWAEGHPSHPHTLTIDLGSTQVIHGFTYLPRQDRRIPDSMVEDWRVEGSRDGQTWRPIAKGQFGNIVNDPSRRVAEFESPVTLRHFRFVSLSGAQDKPYAGAAEIGLLGE